MNDPAEVIRTTDICLRILSHLEAGDTAAAQRAAYELNTCEPTTLRTYVRDALDNQGNLNTTIDRIRGYVRRFGDLVVIPEEVD